MKRVAILLVVVLALAGCSSSDGGSAAGVDELVEVTYIVDGTPNASVAGAEVTMQTPTGQTQKKVSGGSGGAFSEHFTYTFDGKDSAAITVQNSGDIGQVRCRIKVNGIEVSSNTSDGPYGIATCAS